MSLFIHGNQYFNKCTYNLNNFDNKKGDGNWEITKRQ